MGQNKVQRIVSYDAQRQLYRVAENIAHECTESSPQVSFSRPKREILKLHSAYNLDFKDVSILFDKWEQQQKRAIKALLEVAQATEKFETHMTRARMVASSVDLVGTGGALLLSHIDSSWSHNLHQIATLFGCFGFLATIIEMTQSKSMITKAFKEVRKSEKLLRSIISWFQRMNDFDYQVQNFFPHTIDLEVVKYIQEKDDAPATKMERKQLSQKDFKALKQQQMCLAVLISNFQKNPDILDNHDFLHRVEVFVRSPVAEKWFNRTKYRDAFNSLSTYREVQKKLESLMRDNTPSIFSASPLPVYRITPLTIWGSLFMSSRALYNAYSQLRSGTKSKNAKKFRALACKLKDQLNQINQIYSVLNPHYE